MLWLSVHLPRLPLEALPWLPAALAATLPGRCVVADRLVLAADRAARAAGVKPGMGSAAASALAPQVVQLPRDEAREAAFVESLTQALSALTPQLLVEPDGVLLEVHASLRLFGGVRRLLREARRITRAHGARAVIGLAPTATAAQLLARSPLRRRRALKPATATRLLDALPTSTALAVLGQPPALAELLEGIGCRRFGEARALPRAGLQRRGGRALLDALDRAHGLAPDARRWYEPPLRFAMSLELMQRADDAHTLAQAAERLLLPLAGWLSRHWLAATRFTLVMRHERGRRARPDASLAIELGQPSRDAAQLLVLLRERLARHELAEPVYELSLLLDSAEPCAGAEGHLLLDERAAPGDLPALLDRLSARLGAERVCRLALRADHRPECADALLPATSPIADETSSRAGHARPLWLLHEALPLRTDATGAPLHEGTTLTLGSRPERIECGWYDGAPVRRDYHLAAAADQRLCWIYREHRSEPGAPGWFLHGWFG